MSEALFQSDLPHLELLNRGKVRDIYAIDDEHMLIVASDRISAFDVVLPQPIPGKGEVLTRVADFWFARTKDEVPNHLSDLPLAEAVPDAQQRARLGDRASVVKRLAPLPLEAIVRGYLIGSGWKDYQRDGTLCGIELPRDLRQAEQLPEALYTPSTKAEGGDHDENIDFARSVELVGAELAARVRDLSVHLYCAAAAYARARGIIIADT
ncbi:MAG: phosphoribosylaminoimidazolesuccinocarboxamide synthase, partial [bacterium]